ncbi:MAG: ABC transporter ATP-binding protein [bacterium]
MKNKKKFTPFKDIQKGLWLNHTLGLITDISKQLTLLSIPLILRAVFDYAYPLKDLQLLLYLSLIPFTISLLLGLINQHHAWLTLNMSQTLFQRLYKITYKKLYHLNYKTYLKYSTGDLLYRIDDDLHKIENFYLYTIPNCIKHSLQIICITALCYYIYKPFIFLAFIGVPFSAINSKIFSKKIKKIQKENQEIHADLFDFLEQRLNSLKVIKLYKKWQNEKEALTNKTNSLFKIEEKNTLYKAIFQSIQTTISQIWNLSIALFLGYLVIQDICSMGDIIALAALISMIKEPSQTLLQQYMAWQSTKVSFERILDLFKAKNESNNTQNIKKTLAGQITFKNIYFSYHKNKDILQNLNFNIPKRSSVGIVGKSGIGKSSIADLLLRFYTATKGDILIDSIPIQDYNLVTYRDQIALIQDKTPLLALSIKENIGLGLNKSLTNQEIITLAKKAHCHDFITNLPQGYDTKIDPHGQTLSQGQQQRIAIARALATNPKIMIFDEASSGLDSQSEEYIHRIIQELKKEKTMIIMTHRLSSLQGLDKIVVIGSQGSVVEEGSLEELLQRRGPFHKLYEQQFGSFQHFLTRYNDLRLNKHNLELALLTHNVTNIEENLNYELSTTLDLILENKHILCHKNQEQWWILFIDTSTQKARQDLDHACHTIEKNLFKKQYTNLKLSYTLQTDNHNNSPFDCCQTLLSKQPQKT